MSVEKVNLPNPRNSEFRRLSRGVIEPVVKKLFNLGIQNPDMLTAAGTLIVTLGAYLAAKRERTDRLSSLLVVTTVGVGSLFDAFDGALARYKDRLNPGSVDFSSGQLKNVASDRVQEFAMAISRMYTAQNRRHNIGEAMAIAAAVTNPLPSLARATAEMSGKTVPETGKGVFGLIGTRIGRSVSGTVALAVPQTQLFLDALTAVSNTYTTIQRLRVALDTNQPSILLTITRQEAQTRALVLTALEISTIGTTAMIYEKMHSDKA